MVVVGARERPDQVWLREISLRVLEDGDVLKAPQTPCDSPQDLGRSVFSLRLRVSLWCGLGLLLWMACTMSVHGGRAAVSSL